MVSPILHGLPPVVGDRPAVLILGSFPSALSLTAGQYYGNPRNAFWPIMSRIFNFDPAAPYEARLAVLRSHGVALWDVLHACRRVGSADAAIDPQSLVVNDFGEFLAEHPTVERVYFNGAKAAGLYRRLAPTAGRLHYERLPSTSPAHAVRPDVKLTAWRAVASIASAAQPGEAGRRHRAAPS